MISHIAYSDESNWNNGTYRSICMISGNVDSIKKVEALISSAMKDSGVNEFKWSDFRSAKLRFAAEKIIKIILPYCINGSLRIDTIIWDINDNRHRVSHRDDAKNLGRMYYHLFHYVMKKRWTDNAVWMLCPDEQDQMDWELLREILGYKASQVGKDYLFKSGQAYEVSEILKCNSKKKVMIQVADLFAGMACYSKLEYSKFMDWMVEDDGQMTMFDMNFKDFNDTHRSRFSVMKDFHEACTAGKLGVGLNTHGCFRTVDPKNPVNFWWYTPQHINDKAPTRFKLTEAKNKVL